MFCTKCGAQLPEDSEFCTKCGTKLKGAAGAVNQIPVQQEAASAVTPQAVSEQIVHGQAMPTQKAVNNNRNKIAKPFIIAALLFCVIAVVWYSKSSLRQDMLIKKGAEALRKQDYTEAISYYQKMKKANAENEAVYLYGADVCLAQNRWKEAIHIIDEGIALTGADRLQKRREYICDNLSIKTANYGYDGHVECEYDKSGNLIKALIYRNDTLEISSEYQYDKKGNLIRCLQEERTEEAATAYEEDDKDDKGGRELTYDKSETELTYDKNGNLLTWTTYRGNFDETFQMEYDENGNLVTVYDDFYGGKAEKAYSYEYDTDGNLLCVFRSIYGEYDSYEYDENGNLITAKTNIDNSGSFEANNIIKYEYDKNNRLSKVILDEDYALIYEYDKAGRLSEIKNDADEYVEAWIYEYDKAGNLIKLSEDWGTGREEIFSFEYDKQGTLIKMADGYYDDFVYGAECEIDGVIDRELLYDGDTVVEYTYVYTGDILCTSDISPVTGMIQIKDNKELTYRVIPNISAERQKYNADKRYYNDDDLILYGTGESFELYPYYVHGQMKIRDLQLDVERYGTSDPMENLLGETMFYIENNKQTTYNVIGETAGFYQLENGWYVEKNQPGIIFTKL